MEKLLWIWIIGAIFTWVFMILLSKMEDPPLKWYKILIAVILWPFWLVFGILYVQSDQR